MEKSICYKFHPSASQNTSYVVTPILFSYCTTVLQMYMTFLRVLTFNSNQCVLCKCVVEDHGRYGHRIGGREGLHRYTFRPKIFLLLKIRNELSTIQILKMALPLFFVIL